MSEAKVAIWSLFRDNEGEYIDAYMRRINALDWPPENIRLYLVEGDSVDNTLGQLQATGALDSRITVLKQDTGIQRFGSVTNPVRFECLAKTANIALEIVAKDGWCDLGLHLESDLLFRPDLLKRLTVNRPDDDAVIAPMVWIQRGNDHRFYDIWAFRMAENEMFPPYPAGWYGAQFPKEVFECWSTGSAVLFPAWVLGKLRYNYEFPEVIMGLTRQAAEQGCLVCCDPTTHVLHPPDVTSGLMAQELALWQSA